MQQAVMSKNKKSSPILAIDFGTSHSLVSVYADGRKIPHLQIDPSHTHDSTLMRTLVYFLDPDTVFFGFEAIQEYIANDYEGRLFRSFKSHLPNQAYLGSVFEQRVLSLEFIIGLFLLEIKKRAEKILNEKIDCAVIGRPARYSMDSVADGFALHRMLKAAQFAGFKEVQFVPEPLAAAFEARKNMRTVQTALIGDFGGGTSDFTIMKIHPNEFDVTDILAIDGCPQAGDLLDSLFMSNRLNTFFGAQALYKYPMSSNLLKMPPLVTTRLNHPAHIVHLKEKETYDFIKEVQKCALGQEDKERIQKLFVMIEDQQAFSFFETVEACKRLLSVKNEAAFEYLYPDMTVVCQFTKIEFEEWMRDFKKQIQFTLDNTLTQAQLSPDQIDLVFLTGGTSKVPFVNQIFKDRFGLSKLAAQSAFHGVSSGLLEVAELWGKGVTLYPIDKL